MIPGREFFSSIALIGGTATLIHAYIGRRGEQGYSLATRELISIRRTVQIIAVTLLALMMLVAGGASAASFGATSPSDVVAEYTRSHTGLFTHKALAKYPAGIACAPIPDDKTLADVGIILPAGMSEEYLHRVACMPPTEQQFAEHDAYEIAFLSDDSNYVTVFDPINCENADAASTAAGKLAFGSSFKEINPLGVAGSTVLGYAFAKWADNESKKGSKFARGFSEGFCVVKVAVTVRNIVLIIGAL
jgi:hypothetical protein